MIKDIHYKLAELAIEGILKEVACYPSFGLVSPVSSGGHKDMTHFTFIESTSVLYRYFLEMAEVSVEDISIDEIFRRCRGIGIKAERAMFEKTKGINTHKGMIFVLGIALIASGYACKNNLSFDEISSVIREMTKGIVEEELNHLREIKDLTHGERVFLDYGISGIRGEVEEGIPTVFNHSMKVYENLKLEENERLVYTLLEIMSYCEDTTILHRHDLNVLREVKDRSSDLVKEFKETGVIDFEKIEKISREFSRRRVSPGGCADLLAVTVFLVKVKREVFGE